MKDVFTTRANEAGVIDAYLKLFNGGLKLTDKEFAIMKFFVTLQVSYMRDGVKEPYLSELLFSPKTLKQVKTELDISKQNWNNYKQKLQDKKVFLNLDGYLTVNPVLIPRPEITFKFELI
jgi:hypothetical protein